MTIEKESTGLKEFSYADFTEMIKSIMNNVYIKNMKKANEGDNLDSIMAYDEYISALEGKDYFSSHSYSEKDLRAVGINNISLIIQYVENKNNIPDIYRPKLLENKREYIIANYEELNPYYRKLIGLPPITVDNSHFIYLKNENVDVGSYISDMNLPIHELSTTELDRLRYEGVLDMLYQKYNYDYLNFMGSDAIPLRVAREAGDFELLRCNATDVETNIISAFKKYYSINRNYFINVFMMNSAYESQSLYHGFFSMMLLMTTIQSIITENLDFLLARDYVDDYNYDVFLDSYRLFSLKDLPLNYKKILVKNFNYLLKYKGSDKVIVDICKLFGFNDITLMKSYLCKKHKVDSLGTPLFQTTTDSDGKIIPDYDYMYELNFIDIPYDSSNIDKDIKNSTVVYNYDAIADTDNYWGGGEISKAELKQQILKLNFNQILTKYVSLNNMYNVSELNFETAYIFNTLFKLKSNLSALKINLGMIYDSSLPLFDVIIYVYCLMMKKYNYGGEIISDFSTNLQLKGFNFNSDLGDLKTLAKELKLDIDLNSLTFTSVASNIGIIDTLYMKCKKIRDKIYDRMMSSNNIYEYEKLKRLYDSIMHTNLNRSTYTKSNGEVASTYMDYLQDLNPGLHIRLQNDVTPDNVTDELNYVLSRLDEDLDKGNFSYLFDNIETYDVDRLKENLFKIINFFKAHSVQLREMNTVYTLDDKYTNFIKIIDMQTRDSVRSDTDIMSIIDFVMVMQNLKHDTHISIEVLIDRYNDYLKNINIQLDCDIVKRTLRFNKIDLDTTIDIKKVTSSESRSTIHFIDAVLYDLITRTEYTTVEVSELISLMLEVVLKDDSFKIEDIISRLSSLYPKWCITSEDMIVKYLEYNLDRKYEIDEDILTRILEYKALDVKIDDVKYIQTNMNSSHDYIVHDDELVLESQVISL